jgi:L-ascorbate 6-phosphate lactonase
VRLRALGQAGFVLEGTRTRVAIDPYLSDAIAARGGAVASSFVRGFPPPCTPESLCGVQAVLITHAHDDHCDPATLLPLAAADDLVRFVAPAPALEVLRAAGVPESRLIRTVVGRAISVGAGCVVTPVPAAHYTFSPDEDGEPAYVGFVVELDGSVCYHAGDTIVYDGMVECLARWSIDVALLPVNGRDAEREALGIVGNLEPSEAFALAEQIGARAVVPMHNDLFDVNRRDAREVHRAWEQAALTVPLILLPAGAVFTWGGR